MIGSLYNRERGGWREVERLQVKYEICWISIDQEKTVEKPEKPYYLNSNQSQQIIEFKDYILLKEKYLIYYLYKYFYGQLV